MFPYSLNFNSRLVFHLNLIWTLGLQFLSVVGDAMSQTQQRGLCAVLFIIFQVETTCLVCYYITCMSECQCPF